MAIEVTSVHEKRRVIKSVGRVVRLSARAARAHKRRIIYRSVLAATVLTIISISIFLAYSYHYYSQIVDERLAHGYLTSRPGIYAAPRTLRAGQTGSTEKLVALLRRAGYIESEASDVWSGSFTAQDGAVVIHPRRQNGSAQATVRVSFDNRNRIATLTSDAGTLDSFTLEPEALTVDASMKAGQHAALSFRDIPEVVAHAILSTEDRRFFDHSGVDLFGIARAALRNAGDERMGQGGSTITQQLVKNTYLSPERTFRRKFAEAMLAFTLERRLSKQDIFALYCNEVYLGQRGSVAVRGIEQAARVYFAKNLNELSIAEAATIAGMIQSPNRYAPERHAEAATSRRNLVIASMLRDSAITREQAQSSARETLTLAPAPEDNTSLAPYFVDYVNRVTESQANNSSQEDERASHVFTTLDIDLQELAEGAVQHQLERLDRIYKGRGVRPQAALVALDPKTGNVLAMVGGRDYAQSQLNRATDARRQPGSAFKPFVYAAAIESGISPVTTFMDAPREFNYGARSVYRPANYGGGYSMHDVTMRTGLIKSLNVVTVDIALRTGLNRIAALASSFGLPKPQAYPALALGTTEATPMEMAEAYAAFANGGRRVEPRVIVRAEDTNASEILNESAEGGAVVQPATAFMITDMLADVIDHGTARAARGAVKRTAIAGKTG
ncbi:MAG TPA: PBP1A family penicillin-binding protein, partial [Pyrinomonadaceae bacterium]|nr:PBP1A family penicillin-binding protein [Pyrinomonadaceae bacterium]